MLDSLVEILFAVSWKACVIVAVAWVATRLSGLDRDSAKAHTVWVAVLATLLCLPGLEALKLAWPPSAYPAIEFPAPAVVAAGADRVAGLERDIVIPNSGPRLDLRALVGIAYLLGLVLGTVRLFLGWRTAGKLLQGARAVETVGTLDELQATVEKGLLAAPPRLLCSDQLTTPVTIGIQRPAIVLPSGYEQWTAPRVRAVLAHECAHIARRDTRGAAIVALACAIYWFHPLVGRIARHTTRLMEEACDDFAVSLTESSHEYAKALIETASLNNGLQSPTVQPSDIGALAMASHLSSRVNRLLNGLAGGRGVVSGKAIAAVGLAAALATFAAGVLTPVTAQEGGVTLEGHVVDASGARVPGVSLILRSPSVGVTEATLSEADGTFVISGLRPSANYELEAEAGGFANTRQKISLLENGHVVVKVELGRIREAVVVEADAPNEAVSEGPPTRLRVGGNVQRARLIRQVQPVYPEDARNEGVEGTVLLEAIISEEGQPASLTAVNNLVDERLVRAAIDAVSQWRYRPTLLNGRPVEVATTLTIGFQLRR